MFDGKIMARIALSRKSDYTKIISDKKYSPVLNKKSRAKKNNRNNNKL